MGQGTQCVSRDSSHAYMLDAVKLLDNTRLSVFYRLPTERYTRGGKF
jgi:hypothetical protein